MPTTSPRCCLIAGHRLPLDYLRDRSRQDAFAGCLLNTDQGSQSTAGAFTEAVLGRGIRLSMDGKGSWRDNVFVERVWRSDGT
ncbi:transposase domain protein [Burkholderia pseudomallei ABCPW 1]|nr:transposase domain protein [Burkholderia pseudomallei MSHR4000]KGW80518.1 transposase domain protein [Burkholderia pseudomallei MSHR456]KGX23798.1 transposase domain protein [Burkholderia pseudomallei ABCPW 1]